MDEKNNKVILNLQNTLSNIELAFAVVNEAICWVDDTWRIKWCNQTFDRLIEKPHIMILGSIFNEILNFEYKDKKIKFEQLIKKELTKDKTEVKKELILNHKNDKKIFEVIYKRLNHTKNDKLAVIVLRDITLEKSQFQSLIDYEHKLALSERQAGMSDVASSVLHNIGNVLNSVKTTISMIDEKISSFKVTKFN